MSLCAHLLIAVVLLIPGGTSARVQSGSIKIRAEGQELALSSSDLAKLKRHELRMSAEGGEEADTLSGVLLWDLLQLAKVPSPNASGRQRAAMYVKVTGADGQSAVLALVEIDPSFSKRLILVADRRNGTTLNAEEGPWRVFIPDDLRHARWIRGLVAIEILTVK